MRALVILSNLFSASLLQLGPHVDSIKFSGGIVAGLSLLSTRLMRLSPDNNDDNFRSAQLRTTISCDRTPYYILGDTNHEINDQKEKEHYRFDPFGETDSIYEGSIEMKLNRRSLYILSGPLRYTFAHEIFGPDSVSQLFSETESVVPERRLSVIFRDELPRAKE